MSVAQLRNYWGMPDFDVLPKYQFRDFLNRRVRIDATRNTLLLQREKYATDADFFADVERKWSPLHMVDDTFPPTFILHGDADISVPIEQSKRFEDRLKKMGVDVEAVYCPGQPHAFEDKLQVCLSDAISRPLRFQGMLTRRCLMKAGTCTFGPAWHLLRSTSRSDHVHPCPSLYHR
jgi:acetyl esterase/lipase